MPGKATEECPRAAGGAHPRLAGMAQLALTMGPPTQAGWSAVTDRGEVVEVPRAAVQGIRPAAGQRVVASLDETGVIVSVSIGGTRVGLPGTD